MMTIFRAIAQGLGRALASPRLVLLLWLVTFLTALPAAVLMSESIHSAIGPSRVQEELRGELELGWWSEYNYRAKGIETTVPSALSAGAFFDNLEGWFSGELFLAGRGLVALGGLYALVWAFLVGGVLDSLHRGPGRLRTAPFLESGSRYFLRFVRLAVISGPAYYLIYRMSRRLFPWVERLTQEVTVERTVLIYNLLAAAGVIFALTLIHMIFDYAKIATVLESRRSMILAALRGAAFVLAHPIRCCGVYYGVGIVAAGLPFLYFLLAPHPGGSSISAVLAAFLVGQLFLMAKLAVRLALYGSQMALYEAVGRRGGAMMPSLGG